MKILENRILGFLLKLADLILLNLLWLVCSLPVVTLGPATTAANYTAMKMVEDEGDSVAKMFFRSFRLNLAQSMRLGLLFTLLGVVLGVDVYLCLYRLEMEGQAKFMLLAVLVCLGLAFWMEMIYLWALLARFDNSSKRAVILAFMLSVKHWRQTVQILVEHIALATVGVLCVLFVPQLGILFIIFGASLFFYSQAKILRPLLDGYIPKDENQEKESDKNESR